MDIANVNSALSAVRTAEPSSMSSAVSLKMLEKPLALNESMSA